MLYPEWFAGKCPHFVDYRLTSTEEEYEWAVEDQDSREGPSIVIVREMAKLQSLPRHIFDRKPEPRRILSSTILWGKIKKDPPKVSFTFSSFSMT